MACLRSWPASRDTGQLPSWFTGRATKRPERVCRCAWPLVRATIGAGHRLAAAALAELAAGGGFFDQAHLAREFRELAGCAPSRWLAEEFRNVQAAAPGRGKG